MGKWCFQPGVIPEKLDEPYLSQLKAVAAVFSPHLVVNCDDNVNAGTEEKPRYVRMYALQVRAFWSVLSSLGEPDGAFFGPGSAAETLPEAVSRLFEWVQQFKGCGVFAPGVDIMAGVYGPATEEKRKRVMLMGVIPGVWPSDPPEASGLVASGRSYFGTGYTSQLSLEGQVALAKVGAGLRFCYPREGTAGGSILVPHPTWPNHRFGEREDLPAAVAAELLKSPLLGELTEQRNQNKIGWREAGLPGEQYRVFAFVQ